MKLKIIAVALIFALSVSLTGCGSYNGSGGAYSPAPSAPALGGSSADMYRPDYNDGGVYEAESSGGGVDTSAVNTSVQNPAEGLKIIYTADMSIQTKEFEKSMARLSDLIEVHGGYIQNSRVSGGYTSTSGYYSEFYAYLSIRVPSANYRVFLSDSENVGTITELYEYTDDITAAYLDTEARIKSLKMQEERLLALLSQAGDLSDLIEIESKLADVRYQIESFQSIMNTYNNLLSYSTISISMSEVSTIVIPKDTFGERVLAALKGSAEAVLDFLDGLVVGIIYAAPFVAIALVIVFIVRRATRKRRLERKAARESRNAVSDAKMAYPMPPTGGAYMQNPYMPPQPEQSFNEPPEE